MWIRSGTFVQKSLLDLPTDMGNDVRGKNVSFSYSTDTQKETKGRMQRDCSRMKLKMAAAPAFKLLSAVMI